VTLWSKSGLTGWFQGLGLKASSSAKWNVQGVVIVGRLFQMLDSLLTLVGFATMVAWTAITRIPNPSMNNIKDGFHIGAACT
jgi:hypothetical protein